MFGSQLIFLTSFATVGVYLVASDCADQVNFCGRRQSAAAIDDTSLSMEERCGRVFEWRQCLDRVKRPRTCGETWDAYPDRLVDFLAANCSSFDEFDTVCDRAIHLCQVEKGIEFDLAQTREEGCVVAESFPDCWERHGCSEETSDDFPRRLIGAIKSDFCFD